MKLIIVALFSALVVSAAADPAHAQGSFDITDTSSATCNGVTNSIVASSLPATLGFDFEVTYNSAVVRATQVTLGAQASGCQFAANLTTPGVAVISIGCGTPISGSGTIANILFDPIAPGTANLAFQSCQRDETACSAATGGTATLSGCPTISLSPTAIGALPSNGTTQGRACMGARLTQNGNNAAATTTDITFDSRFMFSACTKNPVLSDKTVATQLTPGSPNSVLRVTVSGSTTVLPTGPLFVCTFRTPVVATLPLGAYPFLNSSTATTPAGLAIGALGGNAQVRVTACSGDCDGNGIVPIGEVQRALNEFGGLPLCNPGEPALSCPTADANNNGGVAIGEVQSSLNRFSGNAPCP